MVSIELYDLTLSDFADWLDTQDPTMSWQGKAAWHWDSTVLPRFFEAFDLYPDWREYCDWLEYENRFLHDVLNYHGRVDHVIEEGSWEHLKIPEQFGYIATCGDLVNLISHLEENGGTNG